MADARAAVSALEEAGVPVGIWAAHNPRAWAWLNPVLDLMQTMPTFVYLLPVVLFFGIGVSAAVVSRRG